MFRGCPATGRMSHRFDPATHRCACGRWERGFKPAQEPTKPRDECQICERQQALHADGNLGHHGYKRPGWGFITGDCMGVGHKPYPATDALELYLIALRNYIEGCKARLAELPTLTEIEYRYEAYMERTSTRRGNEFRTVVLKRGDQHRYEGQYSIPSFEVHIAAETLKAETDLTFAEQDERRVVTRIAKATAK
jgi:hypothetical protein